MTACQTRVESLSFSVHGNTVSIREKPGVPEDQEGFLLPDAKGTATPVYSLKTPVILSEPEDAFSIRYTYQGDSLTLVLYTGDDEESLSIPLPAQGTPVEFVYSFETGFSLKGFQVRSKDREGAGRVLSAGTASGLKGVRKQRDYTSIGYGFSFTESVLEGTYQADIDVPVGAGDVITLEYDFNSSQSGSEEPVELIFRERDSGNTEDYILVRKPGGAALTVPVASLEVKPDVVTLRSRDKGFSFKSITVQNPDRSFLKTPLPADFTSILFFPQSNWRNDGFELFRWSSYPEILVFDTADYAVQARYFKRLAFFVEKKGFKGTILTNQELQGKHGWNAHDYRAADLAEFFQKAEETGFLLNEEELLLKEILVDNGVLVEEGTTVSPGNGGVLSISRESPEYLRRKFIVHEGLHGIFFTDSDYREAVAAEWASLGETEKEFWYLFFRWMAYSVDDDYLVVNEYQAYMLQRAPEEAESYFRSHGGTIWAASNRDSESSVARQLKDHPDFFTESARSMEAILKEFSGFSGGHLFRMDRVD